MVGCYVIALMFSGALRRLILAAKKLEVSLASQFANDIGNREFVSRKAVHRVSMDEPQHGHSIRQHGRRASCSRTRRAVSPGGLVTSSGPRILLKLLRLGLLDNSRASANLSLKPFGKS